MAKSTVAGNDNVQEMRKVRKDQARDVTSENTGQGHKVQHKGADVEVEVVDLVSSDEDAPPTRSPTAHAESSHEPRPLDSDQAPEQREIDAIEDEHKRKKCLNHIVSATSHDALHIDQALEQGKANSNGNIDDDDLMVLLADSDENKEVPSKSPCKEDEYRNKRHLKHSVSTTSHAENGKEECSIDDLLDF